MKMRLLKLLAVVVVIGCAAPAYSQIILIDDDFDSGTNPGYTGSDGIPVITVVTDGSAGLTGNALLFTSVSSNRYAVRSLGSSVTLAGIGDYIEVSLDYRITSEVDVNFSHLVRLVGAGGTSGELRFNPNPLDVTDANNTGTYATDADSNAGRFDSLVLGGTTAHSLTLRITKTSETQVRLTSAFDSVASDPSNLQLIDTEITSPLSFNTLNLGWAASQNASTYYDNVLVTTNVPEPGSVLLLGLGTLALLMRRGARR